MKYYLVLIFSLVYLVLILAKYQFILLSAALVNHGADLLCLPLMLSLSVFIIKKVKQDPGLRLSYWQIFAVFTYISFVFELILPQLTTKFTADWLDVGAYAAGGIIYLWFRK